MKKEFIGYYDPTDEEITQAWTKGVFAFDTNTVLNLYRYTELTRKDFLGALKTLKDKLFIPHQVALEFHTKRIGVIEGIEAAYSELNGLLEEHFKKVEGPIKQYNKHPTIKVETISKLHKEFLAKVSEELNAQKQNHPDFKNKDAVLDQVSELFENAVGKEFPKEELKKIYEEGKSRYDEKIPPGYMDLETKRKKGERHIYGDLIIWKELIKYTKEQRKPIVFVTDDRKEDWWTIDNGKTIRPREELIKEFFDLTGIRILIYNADNFLKYAKEKNLVPQLKDKTIKEVKEVRISDENANAHTREIFGYDPDFLQYQKQKAYFSSLHEPGRIQNYLTFANPSFQSVASLQDKFLSPFHESMSKFVSPVHESLDRYGKFLSPIQESVSQYDKFVSPPFRNQQDKPVFFVEEKIEEDAKSEETSDPPAGDK